MSSLNMPLLVGREKEHVYFSSLLSGNNPLSSCFVVTGPPGCGKSLLVSSTFKNLEVSGLKWISVSCLECCSGPQGIVGAASSRFLFELILHSIKCRYLSVDSNVLLRCENASAFLENLCDLLVSISHLNDDDDEGTFGIIFEQAERLCDVDSFILPLITRLGDLVEEHISSVLPVTHVPKLFTVLVTRLPWEKFNFGTFYVEPCVLTIDNYSRDQLFRILLSLSPENSSKTRFPRFLDLLLTICYPVCRNTGELIHLMNVNWVAFEEPVLKGLVSADDEWGQWKLAQPVLKRSLSTLYLRQNAQSNDSKSLFNSNLPANFLELPYYTRYLLIAAFIASYNPQSSDKKFFIKNTGKISNRKKRLEKCGNRTQTQLTGPRSFPLDRLLSIFYILIQDDKSSKIPCTSFLTSQIACLTALGLLGSNSPSLLVGGNSCMGTTISFGTTGNASNDSDPLANPKYRCLVTLETAKTVAQSVDFDLLAHLTDFYGV